MRSEKLTQIENAWFEEVKQFNSSPAIQRLIAGEVTIAHYQAPAREIYFYARESPQFVSAVPIHLLGRQREFTKMILQHAAAEFEARPPGPGRSENIGRQHCHNCSSASSAGNVGADRLSFYLIEYLNPVNYPGFIFRLEYLPTHFGERYAKGVLSAGIPSAAMAFISEHVEADVGHNRLMAEYVENLLVTEGDVEDVIYAMRVTANLYAKVFEAAFRSVNEGIAYDYGVNRAELEPGANNELKQRLAA